MGEDRVDFFVSHAGRDGAWAKWVAWQLIDAGYSVELDVWDWSAGRNFVTAMSDALDRADRVVALTDPSGAARLSHILPTGRIQHVPPDQARLGWLGRYLAHTRLGLALGAGGTPYLGGFSGGVFVLEGVRRRAVGR